MVEKKSAGLFSYIFDAKYDDVILGSGGSDRSINDSNNTTEQNTYTNTDNHSFKLAYTGGNNTNNVIINSAGAGVNTSNNQNPALTDQINPTVAPSQSYTPTSTKTSSTPDNTLLYLGGLAIVGGVAVYFLGNLRTGIKEAGKTSRNATNNAGGVLGN